MLIYSTLCIGIKIVRTTGVYNTLFFISLFFTIVEKFHISRLFENTDYINKLLFLPRFLLSKISRVNFLQFGYQSWTTRRNFVDVLEAHKVNLVSKCMCDIKKSKQSAKNIEQIINGFVH
jgi:hypothetical protein